MEMFSGVRKWLDQESGMIRESRTYMWVVRRVTVGDRPGSEGVGRDEREGLQEIGRPSREWFSEL